MDQSKKLVMEQLDGSKTECTEAVLSIYMKVFHPCLALFPSPIQQLYDFGSSHKGNESGSLKMYEWLGEIAELWREIEEEREGGKRR